MKEPGRICETIKGCNKFCFKSFATKMSQFQVLARNYVTKADFLVGRCFVFANAMPNTTYFCAPFLKIEFLERD